MEQKHMVSLIQCIPGELVGEVLARVASSSFHDIFNAMLSCKRLNEVGNEEYVYKHVSLEKLPAVVQWKKSEGASAFFNRCKDSDNPEALYRQGVVDYFSSAKIESGLESLRKSANLGHLGALYALGIISLFSEDEYNKQLGIQILIAMKKSKSTRKRVRECREKLNDILSSCWIRNHLVLQQRSKCCLNQDQHPALRTGFPKVDSEGVDVNLPCDACECDREFASIIL